MVAFGTKDPVFLFEIIIPQWPEMISLLCSGQKIARSWPSTGMQHSSESFSLGKAASEYTIYRSHK